MPWLAISLEVGAAHAEALSDGLLEAGAQSVWIEPDGRLSALLPEVADAKAVLSRAARAAGLAPVAFTLHALDDQDWVRSTQAQFAPQCFAGGRLWVVPSWHEPPREGVVLRLDPGLAFGTGSHPSTRLVLGFLEKNIKGGERVLDYGCGSGILAIAAAKLGAARVDAVDLDPQAVETTQSNARANRVELRAATPDELPEAHYDLVVSNILAQPLIVLAPLLARRGKRIALSGILRSQAGEVARAYETWFDVEIAAEEEGWVLLAGTRR